MIDLDLFAHLEFYWLVHRDVVRSPSFRYIYIDHLLSYLSLGKTLLAKAIANESGINFISVKGPELLNMVYFLDE